MFKLIFAVVLAGAVLGCAAYDFLELRKLDEWQRMIVEKRAELQKLAAIDQEVQEYQKKKDYLHDRIVRINQLKDNQKTAAEAVALIASVGDAPIDSVAITDEVTAIPKASINEVVATLGVPSRHRLILVIHGSAEATAAVEQLRQSAPNHTFVFRGTR